MRQKKSTGRFMRASGKTWLVVWGLQVAASGASPVSTDQQDYEPVRVALHLGTQVSGGVFEVEEMAKIVADQGIHVGIFNDHLAMEVVYGLFPLRKLIRKRVQRPSIATFGVERYVEAIERADRGSPALLLPGAEVSSFYYWEGSPWHRNLRLRGWHRHLLVMGLKTPADFATIPTLAQNHERHFTAKSLFNLVYAVGLVVGGVLFRTRAVRQVRFRGMRYEMPSNRNRVLGAGLILACAVALVNNFPFTQPRFSSYDGDAGAPVYQRTIDYVVERGGLVYWAHPEVEHSSQAKGVELYTAPYPHLLAQTRGYTGLCIFWEGMKTIGSPGGLWDQLLLEYCAGRRQKPIWAVGELDFEELSVDSLVRETNTVVFVRRRTPDGVLAALREGRVYATRNFAADFLRLVDFAVVEPGINRRAVMGEHLLCRRPPGIRIHLEADRSANYAAHLIRDGAVVQTFTFDKSLKEMYFDENLPKTGRHFYRLLIQRNGWVVLASNPIFVSRSEVEATNPGVL